MYYGTSAGGTRIYSDFRILNGAVTDAVAVRGIISRAAGPDVVKASRPGAGFLASLNAGDRVTLPMIVQLGSYDENSSSSWTPTINGIWTPETVPTSFTLEILDASGIVLSKTVSLPASSQGFTVEQLLPAAPTLSFSALPWVDDRYKGFSTNFIVAGFSDAEAVRVEVLRADGSTVVKTAKPTIVADVNDGTRRIISAPIVIQQGAYNEAGSSSWYMPAAVWTSETAPVSVTVTVVRAYGPDVSITSSAFEGSGEGILPAPDAPVQLAVPTEVAGGGSYEVVLPEGAVGGALDLGTPVGGSLTVPVPVTISSPVGAGVSLPRNVTVTAVGAGAEAWDGVIQLPTIIEDVVVSGDQTEVALAIELGSPAIRLAFDAPVRIVLTGQAGTRAGFIEDGAFTAIDTE